MPRPDDTSSKDGRQKWRLIGIAASALLLLIVFAQNLESVSIQVLFFKLEGLPLAVVLVATALLGYIIGLLSMRLSRSKKTDRQRAKTPADDPKKPAADSQKK